MKRSSHISALSVISTLLFLYSLPNELKAYGNRGNRPLQNIETSLAKFQKVAESLLALRSVKYHYVREFNYPGENYHSQTAGDILIDFSPANDLAGFRYQYRDSKGLAVFNNAEYFYINYDSKTIKLKQQVKLSEFEGMSSIYNSMVTLRNALPMVIKDSSIVKSTTDTIISGKQFDVLIFALKNKQLSYLGTLFNATTAGLTFHYRIIADKVNHLPITVLQTKTGSEDLNRTDLININILPTGPEEVSWYYSNYLKEYTPENRDPIVLIKKGQSAPDWQLTEYVSGENRSLESYKGKIVLLEFWIKNCGYCIEAVKTLNELQHHYSEDKFKVLAVNTEDSKANIGWFADHNKVKYSILYGKDGSLNKNYGVSGFPQAVLLDQRGVVIYSGGLELTQLKKIIDRQLL